MKIGTWPNLRVLISNPLPNFKNFDFKLHYMGKFGPKLKMLHFPRNLVPDSIEDARVNAAV